ASYCGISRCCLRACCCACVAPTSCTVMKTIQETVYEDRRMTVYHIEYGDVTDTVKVPVVKYKEVTAYRCCCDTVYQLPPTCACPPGPPVKTCGPVANCANGACGPSGCPELVPVKVLK